MMSIRGIEVSHQSIYRWVGKLGKEFGQKARNLHGKKRTVSWYVDETYVKVKGQWKYLYRAVDRNGEVLDVMLSAHGVGVFQPLSIAIKTNPLNDLHVSGVSQRLSTSINVLYTSCIQGVYS
jgi:hypothetical protein